MKQGWIATSPLAEVKAVGQRNRGKKQLRIDEARMLVDLCIRKANEGDEAAVGAMAAFLLGLRASEVTDRVVRDLDDDYIDAGTARRARTRRVVGKMAPDPVLRVMGDEPATAARKAPLKAIRRATRKMAADPSLHVVGSETASAAAPASEPTGSPQMLGNG